MSEIAIIILLAIAAVFSILGVIGLFRLPDFYTRTHSAGLVGSFGLLFTAAAVIVFAAGEVAAGNSGYVSFIFHAVFALIIVLITATTSTHIIARSAHRSGNYPIASVDALKDSLNPAETDVNQGGKKAGKQDGKKTVKAGIKGGKK